jgi:histidyl-tRNA synthetase
VGPDERAQGRVMLKDLAERSQEALPREGVAAALRQNFE